MATINLGTIGFTFKGDYDASVTYSKQDVVREGVDTYVSLVDDNAPFLVGGVLTPNTPSLTPTHWAVFTQGLGVNTGTNNGGVWYFDGTNVQSLAPGSENEVLRIGSSGNPEWARDDSRSGVRVANLTSTRSTQHYRRMSAFMEDGSMRTWGYNGNYQHGTGSSTSSKSYPVNPGFRHDFPGVKLDTRKPTNRHKTTITLIVTQTTQSVQDLDASGQGIVDAQGNPTNISIPQYEITLPGGGAAPGNIDMKKGNIYKLDLSDPSLTETFIIEESSDGGTTWSTLARQEIGNNFETSWYTNGGTLGVDLIAYIRIGEDEDRMYRYVSSASYGSNSNINGDVVGSTITLNTTGFVDFFRHTGEAYFSNYNNAVGVIDANGHVWMWGNNSNGVCGTGTVTNQYTPYPAWDDSANSIYNKTAIMFAGEMTSESNNTCTWVLTDDYKVHHCGYSAHGQTGNGQAATSRFVECANTTKIVDIHQSCDNTPFCMMLEADGTLKYVGYGGTYCNGANTNNASIPTAITSITVKVAEILYAGRRQIWVRDIDGNCWNWGNDNYGYLGRGGTAGNYSPAIVFTNNADGTDCACEVVGNPDGDAYENSYIRTVNGTLWSAGYNGYGQLCNGNTTNSTTFVNMTTTATTYWSHNNFGTFPTNFIKMVAAGSGSYGWGMFLTEDGEVYLCGYNGNGQLGTGDTSHVNNGRMNRAFISKKIIDISAAGYLSECASVYLTDDGHMMVCGYNGDSMITGDDAERQDMPKMVIF